MFLILSALVITNLTQAAEREQTHGAECRVEINTYCSAIRDRVELAKCLIKNEDSASSDCKGYLERIKPRIQLASNSPLPNDLDAGGNDLGRGGMGMLRSGPPSISFGGWYTPYAIPSGIQFHQGHLSFPIYKGETDTLSLSGSANTLLFDHAVKLAGSSVMLPTQFYKMEGGPQYTHKMGEGELIGGGLQAGEASDKPLVDSPTYGANIFYSTPWGEHSRWVFSLQYSNNSTFLNGMPIPGIVYIYKTENFTGMFGFPFASIHWRPADPWTISASIFGTTISAELAYGERKKIQAFIGYHGQRMSYMRYARINSDDRVKFEDKRIAAGLRFPLFGDLQTEFAGGYAFGRSVVESSKSSFRLSNSEIPTSFNNTWFAGWNFRLPL